MMGQASSASPTVRVIRAVSHQSMAPLIGPAHSHADGWQIVYVVDAEGSIRICDNWHPVSPHDLYVIKPGQPHASEDKKDACPALWEFRLECRPTYRLPVSVTKLPNLLRQVREPALLETMRQLIDEYSARQHNWEWLCASLAEQLLLRIERHATEEIGRTQSVTHRLHSETMAGIRRYIHFHSAQPLTVAHLARQAAMSPRRFATVFRDVCGKPPMRYVMDVRLDRATELLREGRWTVSEVAHRTGFSSVHYFSRAFRRHWGMSPSQYRTAAGMV